MEEDRSPDDADDGKSLDFSSAEDAVEGRLALVLLGLAGRARRGAGEIEMCGAVAVREKEMSFKVRDGTDMDVGTSPEAAPAGLST